jgi:poly(ADP-ribose) glycohydrolase
MFACHPELNCARLVFTPMLDDEAFILCGAEQFAAPEGYAFNLRCGGPYEDTDTAVEGGQLRAFVTAIDAMDYRGSTTGPGVQFQAHVVGRELLKAFAGFALPPEVAERAGCSPPSTLATGNWGSGAFLGDGRLKALVQWAAASEAELEMCYFPFGDQYLEQNLGRVTKAAVDRDMTVGHLCTWLMGGDMQSAMKKDRQFDVLKAFDDFTQNFSADESRSADPTAQEYPTDDSPRLRGSCHQCSIS